MLLSDGLTGSFSRLPDGLS